MNKAVFLDRDGVLNHVIIKQGKPYPPANLDELVIPADALEALTRLKSHGFLLLGATNQPDVARGKTSRETVESINAALLAALPLDDIRVCYHDDLDQCACRKPLPGLILEAAKQFEVDLSRSVMIGDRWKDIEAGIQAGCQTIWMQSNYDEPSPPRAPDCVAHSLREAAEWIVGSIV